MVGCGTSHGRSSGEIAALAVEVETQVDLPEQLGAQEAVAAVLRAMRERLGDAPGGARVIGEMSDALRTLLLSSSSTDPARGGPSSEASEQSSGATMLERCMAHLDVDAGIAEPIARAVLRVIRLRLSREESRRLEGSLPRDVRELWVSPSIGPIAGEAGPNGT